MQFLVLQQTEEVEKGEHHPSSASWSSTQQPLCSLQQLQHNLNRSDDGE